MKEQDKGQNWYDGARPTNKNCENSGGISL